MPLSAGEIAVLRAWIDRGAEVPAEKIPEDPRKHWAYQVPTRPAVPPGGPSAWSRNPIDAFLAAGHAGRGLQPSPPVGRDLWLRRVTLDLVGVTPTREELHAFRDDTSPVAEARAVERLLASPQYGERWGRHWMDVWRYSDWYGLGQEIRFSHPHIWRWRDWIVESLNADKGYDRMVAEMLAGDELAPDDPATLRATGFLARNWDIFNRNAWLSNTVDHTARAFLGVTIQCARCHDHKFDPLSQAEYYRLRAFFEPFHIRIDRVPGQPDRTKGGLTRVFDDFMDAPTYLLRRGDEGSPDKSKPLTPTTPAVLGGEPIRIVPVSLPATASTPDKLEFVIREARAAEEQAVSRARAALDESRRATTRTAQAQAAAEEAGRQAQSKFLAAAGGTPDARKPLREAAIKAVEQEARARRAARDAAEDLGGSESSAALAELKREALEAVLRVERLEDRGEKEHATSGWADAARRAAELQRRLAVREAEHEGLEARRAESRALRTLEGLAPVAGDPKEAGARAAFEKAAAGLVEARGRLAAAEKKREAAEAAAKAPPTTAYAPRPLAFPRAKTTYREETSNAPYPKVSSGRRTALARWITDRRNPLTARVAVNHIWTRHFGEPLVASMFDFGLRTGRPEHLELLDWLAVELIESGWSMKRLHRLIVTSEAYRMRSAGGPAAAANAKIDPDNRYLWRMNVRRMEGEVIRDTLLHLAGRLERRMGGADEPVAAADAGTRRTLYYRSARDDRIPFLTTFDAPNVEECYRRDETIVPQQALALSNSALALARSGEIAAAIDREVGDRDAPETRAAFVTSAFERLLGRGPTDAERAECEAALNRLAGVFASENRPGVMPHSRAREALVHVLLNHNDFITIR